MGNFDWKRLFRMESGSVLMILAGVVLVLVPDLASAAVSAVLGWVLILAGVVSLVAGFVGRLGVGTIASGALLLAAGSWLHRNPLMLASVLGFLLGALIVSQGVGALMDALAVKRRGGMWIPGMIFAGLMLLVGLRLIFSPLTTSRLVMTAAGVIMAVCGICSLVAHNRVRHYLEEDDGIIDAEA